MNGAQSGRHGNHLEPAINDGPNKNTVFVLHSTKLLKNEQFDSTGNYAATLAFSGMLTSNTLE